MPATAAGDAVLPPNPAIRVKKKERRADGLGRFGVVNLGIFGQGLLLVVQRFQLGLNGLDSLLLGLAKLAWSGFQFLDLGFQLAPFVGQFFEFGGGRWSYSCWASAMD